MAYAFPSERASEGALAGLWHLAARHPLVAILAVVLAQHALTIPLKDLWYMDEARHGGVLLGLLRDGDWLALSLNGGLYPDKPPVYFWYLGAIAALLGTTAPVVFYLGLAGTVAMMLWAAHRMALRLTGDRDTALATVLILASGHYFVGVTHFARMDMMFSAAIVLSWTQFHLATRESVTLGRGAMLAGFAFAALAAMVKGPVGVMLPLLTLVAMLLWQRRPGALLDRSVLGGLALTAGVIALWAGGMIATAGTDYFGHLLQTQIVDRGLDREGVWLGHFRYAVTLPLIFLPWTLLAVLARRGAGGPGTAFLWVAAGTGAVALSAIAEKHEYYLLPLLVPLSILAARGLLGLSGRRLGAFWTLAAGVSAALGGVLILAAKGWRPFGVDAGDYGPPFAGAALPGALLLAGAAVIWLLRARTRLALVVFAALQAAFITLGAYAVFPGLDRVLSPRGVAEAMAAHVATGHVPGVLHDRKGAFAYHLGTRYADLGSAAEFRRWLAATPRAVAAMPEQDWWPMSQSTPEAGAAGCVRFLDTGFVIVTRPAPAAPVDATACDRGP